MDEEEIKKAADELVEQDEKEPLRYRKPFPAKAVPSRATIPGRLVSRGTPWKILLYAEDAPVPLEMFKVMDLHKQAQEPGFIGWIGGTLTKGVKDPDTGEYTKWPALFVDEAQSDLLQRTVEFTDPESYKRTLEQRLYNASKEYAALVDELTALRREFAGSQAYMPLKRRLEIQQRIGDLEGDLERVFADKKREFKYPEYAQYKSKLENYYHKWIEAFFNAALDYAVQQGSAFLCILKTGRVKSEWQSNLSGKEASLFNRIYDKTARSFGMQLKGDWWIGRVEDLRRLESVRLREVLEVPEQWRTHLDTFIRVFAQQEGANWEEHPEGSYERHESFCQIFRFWLDEVGEELITDKAFQNKVSAYLMDKYDVDIDKEWPEAGEPVVGG